MSASKTVVEVKHPLGPAAAGERGRALDSERRDVLARGRSGDRHHRRKRVGKNCALRALVNWIRKPLKVTSGAFFTAGGT